MALEADPVKDYAVTPATTLADLARSMREGGGFTAKKVHMAAEILARMTRDGARVILSLPAAPLATGLRGVVRDLVDRGLVHAIVTTCGFLDHDAARVHRDYYRGSFQMDDAKLHDEGVHRLGSVLVPNDSYGVVLEEMLQPFYAALHAERPRWAPHEIAARLGAELAKAPRGASSVLAAAAARKLPVFVPGFTDGAVGSQAWFYYQKHRDFTVDVMADEQAFADFVFGADKLGAFMVGGGISKHHTIWWSQFRDGLDYAVYITTAVEHDGSLSGARLREAVSWGKLKAKASRVTIEGDATLVMPLVVASWLAQIG